MARSEDSAGIHYVKDKANPASTKEICVVCRSPATCMPRLYVPCSVLSINRGAEDVSALMAVTFCDRHFSGLKASVFTERQEVRDQIVRVFRERNAYPNFDKAVIGRIPIYDPDFARGQKATEIARKS